MITFTEAVDQIEDLARYRHGIGSSGGLAISLLVALVWAIAKLLRGDVMVRPATVVNTGRDHG